MMIDKMTHYSTYIQLFMNNALCFSVQPHVVLVAVSAMLVVGTRRVRLLMKVSVCTLRSLTVPRCVRSAHALSGELDTGLL